MNNNISNINGSNISNISGSNISNINGSTSDSTNVVVMDVTYLKLDGSVFGNGPGNIKEHSIFTYNPLKFLSARVERSFSHVPTQYSSESGLISGNCSRSHGNKSLTGNNNSYINTINNKTNSNNNLVVNTDEQLTKYQTCGREVYPCVSSASSYLSTSPSMSPMSSHLMHTPIRTISPGSECPGHVISCCDNMVLLANENQSRDFSGDDLPFIQAPPANHHSDEELSVSGTIYNSPCHLSSSNHTNEEYAQLPRWTALQPRTWSNNEVLDWVFFVAQEQGIDMQAFKIENFQGHTGEQLYQMTLDDFVRLEPRFGAIIYNMFRKIMLEDMTTDTFLKQEECNKVDSSDVDITWYDFDVTDAPRFTASRPEEPFQSEFCAASTDQYPKARIIQASFSFPATSLTYRLPRSRTGRPRATSIKVNHWLNNQMKVKNAHLWEFIYDTLMNPKYNPKYLRWEDQSKGIFRFVQSEAVARLWGGRKNNESMTYEKLSRAMRHYYRRGILDRVQGRRLVYKFSLKTMDSFREQKSVT